MTELLYTISWAYTILYTLALFDFARIKFAGSEGMTESERGMIAFYRPLENVAENKTILIRFNICFFHNYLSSLNGILSSNKYTYSQYFSLYLINSIDRFTLYMYVVKLPSDCSVWSQIFQSFSRLIVSVNKLKRVLRFSLTSWVECHLKTKRTVSRIIKWSSSNATTTNLGTRLIFEVRQKRMWYSFLIYFTTADPWKPISLY